MSVGTISLFNYRRKYCVISRKLFLKTDELDYTKQVQAIIFLNRYLREKSIFYYHVISLNIFKNFKMKR